MDPLTLIGLGLVFVAIIVSTIMDGNSFGPLIGPSSFVLVLFGRWVLGVPQVGSWALLAVFFVLGGLCFAGFGLLVASRARTVEVVSGLMNLVMMPMWLGSGIFFSYERFPAWTHAPLRLLPLTAFNDGVRQVMLEGAGFLEVWSELAVTAGWTVVAFTLALRLFRWA